MNELQPTNEIALPAKVLPRWRFSLAELMFFMTMAAVCCAGWAAHYRLGFLLTAIMIPVGMRTVAENRLAVRQGLALPLSKQLHGFLFSCVAVFIALLHYGVVLCGVFGLFLLVCFLTVPLNWQWNINIVAAVIALACLPKPIFILMRTWPY